MVNTTDYKETNEVKSALIGTTYKTITGSA